MVFVVTVSIKVLSKKNEKMQIHEKFSIMETLKYFMKTTYFTLEIPQVKIKILLDNTART